MTRRSRTLAGLAALGLALVTAAVAIPGDNRNFVTALSGSDEIPQRDTLARGVAIFHLSADETEIAYKLIVANIENVVGAHIHLAPAGVNGPVVVPLFAQGPGGGRTNGTLAEGVFTAAKLAGPLAGRSLADLVEAMNAGGTYVNVHTNDGVAPPNTGPGDFPGGEIRGQIR